MAQTNVKIIASSATGERNNMIYVGVAIIMYFILEYFSEKKLVWSDYVAVLLTSLVLICLGIYNG